VAKLSPKAAIAVVALPGLVLVPLKLLGLWLLAGGAWFSAVLMLVLLKLVGLGMTGFTFRLCRAKLLELHSFRRLSLALRRLRGPPARAYRAGAAAIAGDPSAAAPCSAHASQD
jgi:hypothetical protein